MFSFCIFLAFFEECKIAFLSYLAWFAIFLIPIIIIVYFYFNPKTFNKKEKTLILFFILFIVLQVVSIRNSSIYSALAMIFRSISLLFCSLFFLKYDFSSVSFHFLYGMTFVVLVIGFVSQLFMVSNNTNYFIGNLNTVGALYFTILMLYLILKNKINSFVFYFVVISSFLLILMSNTRTALFLSLICFFYWLFVKIFIRRSKKYFCVLSISCIFIMLSIFFYYNIKESGIYSFINNLSQTVFHKNFDSGRPDLWHLTVAAVQDKWFGLGTGIRLSNAYTFLSSSATPHSSYFDYYLKNGLLGIILMVSIIILLQFSRGEWKNNSFNLLLLSICFVMLFYNAFGVIFSKPRSSIGLLMWALISIRCKDTEENKPVSSSIYRTSNE